MTRRKNSRKAAFKKALKTLSGPAVPFFLLPVLMLLLVAGTVAQRWLGLYDAQKMFFVSPVLWLGPLPLPGSALLLALIAAALLSKLLFFSPWNLKHAGSHLGHLGVFVFLAGGLLTAFLSEDSFIVIEQGQTQNIIEDYHQREFKILKNGTPVIQIAHQKIHPGAKLPDDRFRIAENCRNCRIEKRENNGNATFKGMAAAVVLHESPPAKQDEENLYGLTLEISGLSDEKDGVYVVFDAMPVSLRLESGGDVYEISYARKKRSLPFSLRLVQFEKDLYAGTDKPRHYASELLIEEGGISWPARVEMNAPLRYKGYSIYQSSFIERPDGRSATVLAVVKNPSWPFPYIGTALLTIGLLAHLVSRLWKKKKLAMLLVFSLLALPNNAQALEMSAFAKLPILHEGRIKPLDSFARIEQRLITDNHQQDAITWLAESLFDPARAAERQLFSIDNRALRRQLKLDEKKFYSFTDLSGGLSDTAPLLPALLAAPESLTPQQKALLQLHEKTFAYSQILGSMTLLLPMNLPATKLLAQENPRWLHLRKNETDINDRIRKIIEKKGDNFDAFSGDEKDLVVTGMRLSHLSETGHRNVIFKVVPPAVADGNSWLAPWEMALGEPDAPETAKTLAVWQRVADSWRNDDEKTWGLALADAKNISGNHVDDWRLSLECAYNIAQPLAIAGIFYALSLLFLVWPQKTRKSLAPALALCGAGVHAVAIATRCALLSRPPVGTLYESLIFVGFIAIVLALGAQAGKRNMPLLGCGAVIALVLLLVAPAFAPSGDNMEMLVAVLNTNFWLSTHVICVTAGYGASILAALLAHIVLAGKNNRSLAGTVHKTLLAALFLMAFGTMLGGIWADQSWGRFWGWDPKENGALLIVLWIVWILHGKLGGYLKGSAYLAAVALLNILVAMSWIGVNLLNIGLHSYGFTGSMAAGLSAFFLGEALLISHLFWRNKNETASL